MRSHDRSMMMSRKSPIVWLPISRGPVERKPIAVVPKTYSVRRIPRKLEEEYAAVGRWPFYIKGSHTCRGCSVEKDVNEFRIDTARRRPVPRCRACESKRRAAKADTLDGRIAVMISGARARSKEWIWPCDLTAAGIRAIWDKQEGRCALSDEPMLTEREMWDTASLDRIDGSKGYTSDNVRLVTDAVNRMRGVMPVPIFADFCLAVAQYQFRFRLRREAAPSPLPPNAAAD